MAEQFQLREIFNPALVNELAGNIEGVWTENGPPSPMLPGTGGTHASRRHMT